MCHVYTYPIDLIHCISIPPFQVHTLTKTHTGKQASSRETWNAQTTSIFHCICNLQFYFVFHVYLYRVDLIHCIFISRSHVHTLTKTHTVKQASSVETCNAQASEQRASCGGLENHGTGDPPLILKKTHKLEHTSVFDPTPTLTQTVRRQSGTQIHLCLDKHVLLFVGCLTSQQHASVSQGRICSDKFYVLPHSDRSC